MSYQVLQGDCIERMAEMEEASVDAVVCDPPYGLEFMGKEWDALDVRQPDDETFHRSGVGPYDRAKVRYSSAPSYGGSNGLAQQEWHHAWATEALRVLKPGGHLLAFGGTRTYHRLACAIEDAGFEIRDSLLWLYGSGFPKSLNVAVAIDKANGAPPRGRAIPTASTNLPNGRYAEEKLTPNPVEAYEPQSEEAAQWKGWGTALKPSHEPIVVARKPLIGTVAANVLEHGTGGINVDGCRIGTDDDLNGGAYSGDKRRRDEYTSTDTAPGAEPLSRLNRGIGEFEAPPGRWPANVVLSEEAAEELDEQTGELSSNSGTPFTRNPDEQRSAFGAFDGGDAPGFYGDSGGPSRFFYCAKTSKAERNAGLDDFPDVEGGFRSETSGQHLTRRDGGDPGPTKNNHPTVKPINLMRWLVRLVTPPGGTVLDPFLGSGTTGCAAALEGFDFIGIEREAEYLAIAEARIAFWAQHERREVEDVLEIAAKSQRLAELHKANGQGSFDELLTTQPKEVERSAA